MNTILFKTYSRCCGHYLPDLQLDIWLTVCVILRVLKFVCHFGIQKYEFEYI